MSHRKVNFVKSLTALAALSVTILAGCVRVQSSFPDVSKSEVRNDNREALAAGAIKQGSFGRYFGFLVEPGSTDRVSLDLFSTQPGYRNGFGIEAPLFAGSARTHRSPLETERLLDSGFCSETIDTCLGSAAFYASISGDFESPGQRISAPNTWLESGHSGSNATDNYAAPIVPLAPPVVAHAVPEPGTYILFAVGLIGMALLGRRNNSISGL
jgi:hypothetical protein